MLSLFFEILNPSWIDHWSILIESDFFLQTLFNVDIRRFIKPEILLQLSTFNTFNFSHYYWIPYNFQSLKAILRVLAAPPQKIPLPGSRCPLIFLAQGSGWIKYFSCLPPPEIAPLLALFLLAFEKVIKSRGMKSVESNGRADNAWKYYSLLSRSRSSPWRSFYFLQKMRWFLLGSISLRAPWPSHLYCNVDHSLCCD